MTAKASPSRRLPIFRLALLVSMFSATAKAAVTLDFLAPSPQWTSTEKEATFYLKSTGGPVTGLRCWISTLTPDRGDPAPRDSFTCTVPASLAVGTLAQLSVKLSPTVTLKRGNYSAVLQVLGQDQTGTAVSQTVTFKVLLPAVALKIGETDTIQIPLSRAWPLSSAKATVPIGVQVTSDTVPTRLPEAIATQLYVQAGDIKEIVPGGYLKAYFCDSKSPCSSTALSPNGGTTDLEGKIFQIEAVVPPGVQKVTGVVRLKSAEFASDNVTPVTLLVKDRWIWAAIAVLLGQILSFSVNRWITVGRQQKLNKVEAAPIESSLVSLLIRRPDLESHAEVAVIVALLDSAEQANILGEVQAADKSLKDAKEKLDQFTSNLPPEQPIAGGPAVVMLQKSRAYPARRLNLVLINPDQTWPANAIYKWEWSGQRPTWKETVTQAQTRSVKQLTTEYLDTQQWRTLYEAQNLKNISTTFWKSGQYILRVNVDGEQVAVLPFRLDKNQSLSFQWRIHNWDMAILLLAVAFAAILSYLAIDKLETFGSVSDYALAFLGGFGLNATTSGFSAVVSRFRGSAN
jgi:hypothetical protein